MIPRVRSLALLALPLTACCLGACSSARAPRAAPFIAPTSAPVVAAIDRVKERAGAARVAARETRVAIVEARAIAERILPLAPQAKPEVDALTAKLLEAETRATAAEERATAAAAQAEEAKAETARFQTAVEVQTKVLNSASAARAAAEEASDIPRTIRDMIRDVDAEALTEEQTTALVGRIKDVIKGVKGLGTLADNLGLDELKGLSFDAAAGLVQVAGGLDKLAGNLTSYVQTYYTDAERQARAQELLSDQFDKLGLKVPRTREAFRDLVEAQDLNTEAGRKNYAALMELNQAFAQLTPTLLEQAGIAANEVANTIRDGMVGRLTREQVGEKLTETVLGGIYNALAGGFSKTITDVFTQQIINPVVEAALTGGVLTTAISQSSIDAVVAAATNAATAIAAIMNDPGFIAAIAAVRTTISGIANAVAQPGTPSNIYAPPAGYTYGDGVSYAVDVSNNAAEEIRDAWKSIGDTITDEIKRIRGELVGADEAGQAFLEARFAILTAKARAGDQDAAQELPEISRAMLDLARENAATLEEYRLQQGRTAESLITTLRIIGATDRKSVV